MVTRIQYYLFVFFMLAMMGCASQRTPATFSFNPDLANIEGADASVVTWPPAGEDIPRYAFVGELRGEDNFVRNRAVESKLETFWYWLTGLSQADDRPRVTRPQAVIASETEARIYVADVGRQSILVFDRTAGELLEWKRATELGGFLQPIALAESANGGLYVSDSALGVVVELDRAGEPLRLIGKNILQRPTGMAVDAGRGRLWVTDTAASDIKVFDLATGQAMFVVGELGDGPGQFNRPTFLAFRNDRVYVSDTLNARVQILSADDGAPLKVFGRRSQLVGDFVRPKGIAVDSDQNIYVVESYHDNLLVFDSEGRFLLNIGGTGEGVGQFYSPSSTWVDQRNQVYVGDMMNGRVTVLKYLGGGAP